MIAFPSAEQEHVALCGCKFNREMVEKSAVLLKSTAVSALETNKRFYRKKQIYRTSVSVRQHCKKQRLLGPEIHRLLGKQLGHADENSRKPYDVLAEHLNPFAWSKVPDSNPQCDDQQCCKCHWEVFWRLGSIGSILVIQNLIISDINTFWGMVWNLAMTQDNFYPVTDIFYPDMK